MNDKIRPTHLERRAAVYLRQSTLKQVHQHRESTTRQYALQQRAVELGWPADRIEVIDEDLGQSGASVEGRGGFQRLAEDVAHGRVGAIFALEVSRLARSSADWHRLLELCALADVVIVDEQAVFSPRDYNDRLLLGLKGTMSEAEQYWMRLRLQGGMLSKARRGELFFLPPAGYEWDANLCRFRLDPDEQVQRAVRLVFERFRIDGSAYAVARYFSRQGLTLPAREFASRELKWVPARYTLIRRMLHNPIYAGAYVFGRSEERMGLVDGQVRRRCKRSLSQEEWKVCLRDHHASYIGWEEFMANERKLHENLTEGKSLDRRGAAREGHALLQGLALCGQCGQRMSTQYKEVHRRAVYACRPRLMGERSLCWSVPARAIDEAVARLFLEVVQPPEIELSLAVVRETERQAEEVNRQWRLRLDRVRYDAQLAERRYKAVDPDNRVVARTLEREWEEKLREMEEIEREHQEVCRREKLALTEEDRARILALAKDLRRVWEAPMTTHAERKNLLRMVVQEVSLSPVEVPERMTRVRLLWRTGAVNDFTVPRPLLPRATPPKATALVRTLLAEGKSDIEIADILNQRGLRTGLGRTWDVPSVRRARYEQGLLRSRDNARSTVLRRADGLYSLRGVAERLEVAPGTARYWFRKGWLQLVEGGGTGHPLWFKLDRSTIERLKVARTRAKARRSERQGGKDSRRRVPHEGHHA